MFYSKIFGNGSIGTGSATEKRIRITTNSTYRLMMKQGEREGRTDEVGLASTRPMALAQPLTPHSSSSSHTPSGHSGAPTLPLPATPTAPPTMSQPEKGP